MAFTNSDGKRVPVKVPKSKPPKKRKGIPPPPSGDQVDRAAAGRKEQLARSKPLAGDRPQTRATDLKAANKFKQGKQYKKDYTAAAKTNDAQFTTPATAKQKAALDAKTRKTSAAGIGGAIDKPLKAVFGGGEHVGLKALEVSARGGHAIAAATNERVKSLRYGSTGDSGGSASHAALEAIKGKNTTSFTDVLKTAGVKNKTVRAIGGFGLDVATDPTTYLTFGAGGVAKKAGEDASRSVIRTAEHRAVKAAKAGDHEGAKQIREKAVQDAHKARQAAEAKEPVKNKGIQAGIRVPGSNREIRTSGKTTAKINHHLGGGNVAGKIRRHPATQTIGKNLAPDFVEHGEDTAAAEGRRHGERRLRAGVRRGEATAHHTEQSIGKAHPAHANEQTIAALEQAPQHVPAGVTTAKMRTHEGEQAVQHAKSVEKKAKVKAAKTKEKARREGLKGTRPAAVRDSQKASTIARHEANNARRARAGAVKHNPRQRTLVTAQGGRYATVRKRLPKEQIADTHDPAVTQHIKSIFAEMDRKETAAGVRKGSQENYYPHQDAEQLNPDARRSELDPTQPKRRGARKFGPAEERKLEGSQREIHQRQREAGDEHMFGEDLATGTGHRQVVSENRIARKNYVNSVVNTGKPYRKGMDLIDPHLNGVFHRTMSDNLSEVDPAKHTFVKGEQYYVLNRKTAQKAADTLVKESKHPGAYARFTGKWKGAYTVLNPGYHVGNFIGNRVQEFLGDATVKSHQEAKSIARVMKKRDKFERSADAARGNKFEDTLTDKQRNLLNLGEEAEKHGGVGSGLQHEVTSLQGKQPGRIRSASERSENKPRLATYRAARKRGMTPDEAAAWVAKHHVDYGDLTKFEKRVREIGIPFYTFTARNTRLQASKLFQRPGKFATFEKAREDSAKYAGEDPHFARLLQRYQQAGAPFIVSIAGHSLLLYGRTPIDQGLGMIPSSPNEAVRQLINRVGPIKVPIELAVNYNSFQRKKIDEKPLVAAPQWIKYAPKQIRDALGVQESADGKMMWGAAANYVADQLGPYAKPSLDATTSTDSQNRFGQKPWQSVVSFLGIKLTDADPAQMKLNQVQSELHKTQLAITELQQLKKTSDPKHDLFMSTQYESLLDRQKKLTDARDKLEKNPPSTKLRRQPSTRAQQDIDRITARHKGQTGVDRLAQRHKLQQQTRDILGSRKP